MPNCSNTSLAVINEMKQRDLQGQQKYNCTMDRTDLNLEEWLQHAKEEAMDLSVYLQRAINQVKQDKTTIDFLNASLNHSQSNEKYLNEELKKISKELNEYINKGMVEVKHPYPSGYESLKKENVKLLSCIEDLSKDNCEKTEILKIERFRFKEVDALNQAKINHLEEEVKILRKKNSIKDSIIKDLKKTIAIVYNAVVEDEEEEEFNPDYIQ